ncbi:MAG: beta-propeller fold lactonase family protein [Planctomycetes bacterium]|nr:beta-propeller fold lactonase family protein [Planctomycetota bacterium]
MKHSSRPSTILVCLWLISTVTCHSALSIEGRPTPLSPIDLVASADGNRLYVALNTGQAIAAVDPGEGSVIGTTVLPCKPAALALSEDGSTLYVAGGGTTGSITVMETADGQIEGTIPVGHTPSALVISPDGKTLYVCCQFDRTVQVIEVSTRTCIRTIPVLREPTAMALSPDGLWLLVTHLLPDGPANGQYTGAKISIIDTRTGKRSKDIALPNGSMSVRDICLSPDGQFAYATHILARYQIPTTQLERGWTNTNALSILDVQQQICLNTVLLDDVDLGAANPWGLTCSLDGQWLSIALSGTHELCVIDRHALHDRLTKVGKGQRVTEVSYAANEVPNDLAFTMDIKQRVKLIGQGPRSVALIKNTAYVAEYFTDSLSVLDLAALSDGSAKSIRLGPTPATAPERQGEQLFYDANLCFQKWHSCATCHPDARADALNWDLLNDGLGNPKNTKSMLLAHATPPSMVTGIRPSAEAAVRAGIRHILFSVRPEAEAVAIDAYLKSLTPVPSPHLNQGRLSVSARRGQAVFEKAGCVTCHAAPLYTNQERFPVGTGVGREENTAFDTPSLIEAWRTAPYLHDGRAATLKEVLTRYNPRDEHGHTSSLSDQEIDDLTAFLLSL